VLVVAMAAVMLGTLYPLFLDALKMGKISVGPPYFDAVFYPLMAPALFLVGIGPIAQWREARLPDLWQRLKWALAVGAVSALLLPFTLGDWKPLVALGLFFALWIFITTGMALRHRFAQSPQSTFWGKLKASTPSYYGMHLAHIGVAVFVVGVTLVKGYEVEKDVRMAPGDSAELRGLTFKFVGVKDVQGPNYNAVRGTVEVYRGGDLKETMRPEKRMYFASGQTMTEADIDTGFLRDVYVSLGEPVQGATDGAWAVRLYVKPFIDWIWGGCFLMALGGFLAIADRRYRIKVKRESEDLPPAAPSKPSAPLPGNPPKQGRRKHRRGGSPATAKV
jgi:cytochrome c-type biogenesis protein CcmF